MNAKQKQTGGIWMMVAASVLFATGGLALKFVSWNSLAINGIRSLFGLPVIALYLLISRHTPVWNRTTVLGAAAYTGVTTLFVMANKLTSAANAIVLQYSAPIWIILLSWLLLHKKPAVYELVTVGCVMVGIGCFFCSSLQTGSIAGDLIALLSGFCYAILFMINSLPGGDSISSVFFGLILSALLFGPLALRETDWSLPALVSVIWLGAFQVGVAYIFFCLGTARISPLQASLISGLEPVLNPLLTAVFAHETLSLLSLLGACIVILSITGSSVYGYLKTSSS